MYPNQTTGFRQSAFQKEFAEFVGFVGGNDIDKAIRKVEQKLRPLPAEARNLFGGRFFFHEQFAAFATDPFAFQLDISDLRAVRAASLIAGVNRVRRVLSPAGAERLRSMLLDNLQPDRDIRQIEHEIRAWTHCSQKGFNVVFADLEGLGNFDLLLEKEGQKIEIECKTVAEDTGSQIKFELNVELTETFRKLVRKQRPIDKTGLFIMQLKRPTSECRHLAKQLKGTLAQGNCAAFEGNDFSLRFEARPQWQAMHDSGQMTDLKGQILLELENEARCVTRVENRLLALTVLPHKRPTLSERVGDVLKNGADQCSRDNPGIVWLHFVGMPEAFFVKLAQHSSDGQGRGLNAIVSNAFHPKASSTNRTHVERVRFSSDADALSSHLAFRPDRLLTQAVSAGGKLYDVPIPHAKFAIVSDV